MAVFETFRAIAGNRWVRRFAGLAFLVASAAYIWRASADLPLADLTAELDSADLWWVALACVAYAAMLALLAFGWGALVVHQRREPHLPKLAQIAIYGRSVPAKYLPGSVLQYASRQVLGASAGLSQRAMARASAAEILLHVAVSLLVAAGAFALAGGDGTIAMLVSVGALTGCLLLLAGWGLKCSRYAEAIGWQAAFFVALIIQAALVASLAGASDSLVLLATIFLIGWLAGFVLPFIPGGIGVREAVILALGAPYASPETLLLFAGAMRVVTLGGDVMIGIASHALHVGSAREKTQALGLQNASRQPAAARSRPTSSS